MQCKRHTALAWLPAPTAGVFITGLEFGTPPQPLQLLIDTGSGITHIASTGCGSSCGIGLAESRGYNFSASSTAAEVPCGEMCSCAYCSCDTLGRQEPACAYQLAYGTQRPPCSSAAAAWRRPALPRCHC